MAYNSIYNNKYTKAVEIFLRISSKHKAKQLDINNFIEWCAECELQEIRSAPEWFLFKGIILTVTDHKALVPCNVYRLLDIMDDQGRRLNHYYDGTYIRLNTDSGLSRISINYYGIPIDEEGHPLIVKGHEKACEYYCLKMLYEEDYLLGKIDANRWSYILNEYADGVIKAVNNYRNLTRNEMEEMETILQEMNIIDNLQRRKQMRRLQN